MYICICITYIHKSYIHTYETFVALHAWSSKRINTYNTGGKRKLRLKFISIRRQSQFLA